MTRPDSRERLAAVLADGAIPPLRWEVALSVADTLLESDWLLKRDLRKYGEGYEKRGKQIQPTRLRSWG